LETSLGILCISALLMGVMHTALGPDHYLPFIAISKARNWSTKKTLLVTLICGLAHVFSSILIGVFGIGFGIAVKSLELVESLRGDLAAWLLVGCGLVYMVWGLFHGLMNREHHHVDTKGDNLTPWALFVIFVFGPCEPLIPILMFPAATIGLSAALLVALVFALATLLTMVGVVIGVLYGLHFAHSRSHRFSHALTGAVILLCGVVIQLGL